MCALARRALPPRGLLSVLVLATALSACSGQKSAKDAEEQFYKDNPKATRKPVAKFAGTVTIDGQPPSNKDGYLFILLNDFDKPTRMPGHQARCNEDGTFTFMTYVGGDGVPPGKYIVEFVQLQVPRGGRQRNVAPTSVYVEPDRLNNLYNDPEKNKNDPNLVVEVKEPGTTDHLFNVEVAGKTPVTTPGPLAVVKLMGH
jgi:hypothetical protein